MIECNKVVENDRLVFYSKRFTTVLEYTKTSKTTFNIIPLCLLLGSIIYFSYLFFFELTNTNREDFFRKEKEVIFGNFMSLFLLLFLIFAFFF